MAESRAPAVFTIPVHRAFADALVNGVLSGRTPLEIARGLILVPNNRAAKAITDAFVRRASGGVLLPRIVPIGDIDDAGTSTMFDDDADLPSAIDPLTRRMILARLVQEERALIGACVDAAEALRLATALGATLDQLLVEGVPPSALLNVDVGALSSHWERSLQLLGTIIDRWPEELQRLGRIDAIDRRNHLIERTARRWAAEPPPAFVIAAGITTAARAVGHLLYTISRMPNGVVVLPGLDLHSPDEEWDVIAGEENKTPLESHPQFQLRQLLDAMRIARSDVRRWHCGDGRKGAPDRARTVSNAFAPAKFTQKWKDLPKRQLALPSVRYTTFATAAEEAQGIAITLREALETPGRTAALVTPDRMLAERVVAHLKRWGVDADDSAGTALSRTGPGTLVTALTNAVNERFAPVALLTLVKHPLVMAGERRLDWLEGARALDLALRGPRPAPGLSGVSALLQEREGREAGVRARAADWWHDVILLLAPLEERFAGASSSVASAVEALSDAAIRLAGDGAWSGPSGRALSDLFERLGALGDEGPRDFDLAALPSLLAQLMGEIAVRPPHGGHPRIAIWGLLEARLQSADLLILGGLNEGVWPAAPAPDPWLAPRIRKELGLGGLDRRIGLAAHDLASALGSGAVLITRAERDARSPTVASRFLLRLDAMTGGLTRDDRIVALARAVDAPLERVPPTEQPAPRPPAALRPRTISVTNVDRLNADPYEFYAKTMLKLPVLEPIDAAPGPAWRGSAIHAVLQKWVDNDDYDPAKLHARIAALMDGPAIHPVLRAMWQPRLAKGIDWIAEQTVADRIEGRSIARAEAEGSIEVAGVTLHGRADRIDRTADGLAIVDYKTGMPPTPKAVAGGFAMQLGLLGLIADRGGFAGITGRTTLFEYWSLAKAKGAIGYRQQPFGKSDLTAETFVARATAQFSKAADRWLTGDEPFTAKLVPEHSPYDDYDQLMRRDEWYGRED